MRVGLYVPCYNGAAWLRECLEALLAQNRPADEVAVVDDGSTDDSAAIVRSFGGAVRLISHDRNRGLAVARNTALAAIDCDVLASVDADVRAEPDWLAALLTGFDSPRTVAVGGRLDEAHQSRLPDRWRAVHMAQHAGDLPLVNPPMLPGANTAVRRATVRDLGGYEVAYRTNYEDADLQHRLIEVGYRCRYVPAARAAHLRTDTASSVLRTYWGWLRPPHEKQGLFRTAGGLLRRQKFVAAECVRALWTDFSSGNPELAYLSLLLGLTFPLADAEYATRVHDLTASPPLDWAATLSRAFEAVSPALAVTAFEDAGRVRWWTGTPVDGDHAAAGEAATVPAANFAAELVAQIPRPWWPAIERSRRTLAAEEGWPDLASESFRTKNGEVDRAHVPAASPEAQEARALLAQVRVLRQRYPDLLALIGHGGDQSPTHLVLVTHRNHQTVPSEGVIASHRIGWLRPSAYQQSLLQTGKTLWGDRAALATVPAWRADQIDSRDALAEMEMAERLLAGAAGAQETYAMIAAQAARMAAGALLVARRAFTPLPSRLGAALARTWPEAPPLDSTDPAAFVACARKLFDDWLFTWEGAGPSKTAREAFRQLQTRYAQTRDVEASAARVSG